MFLARQAAEEERRQEFLDNRQRKAAQSRAAAEARRHQIRLAQNSMERQNEERKQAILRHEQEHADAQAEAEAERQRALAISLSEKDMRVYTRQLKLARTQRRDEYWRDVTSRKVRLEQARTEGLLDQRKQGLASRKVMQATSSIKRQEVSARIEKMRQSSKFDVDETMRNSITNPELSELLERCDAQSNGSGKVDVHTMRVILKDMQGEGKLAMLGGTRHTSSAPTVGTGAL